MRSRISTILLLLAGLSFLMVSSVTLAAEAKPVTATEEALTPEPLNWLDDYHTADQQARAEKQLLFVWFFDPTQESENEKFAAMVLGNPAVQKQLSAMTLLKLPTTTMVRIEKKEVKLLDHPAYAELLKGPGLAMVDFRDPEQKHFGFAVSIYPFQRSFITSSRLRVLCDLPTGTLTQRTLMFAVRTHPAAPKSAWSPYSGYLAGEAEKHSKHQASINLQGHHNWEARFHQINQGLSKQIEGSSFSSKEVCAESWPGQTLLDAAEECVNSWSQSSGHWSAVSASHSFFGYDMKRGSNGVWYATGIFGGR